MPFIKDFLQPILDAIIEKLVDIQTQLRATDIDGVESLEFKYKRLEAEGLQIQKALVEAALGGPIKSLEDPQMEELKGLVTSYQEQSDKLFTSANSSSYRLISELSELQEQLKDKQRKNLIQATIQICRKKVSVIEIQLDLLECEILEKVGIDSKLAKPFESKTLKTSLKNLRCYAELKLEYIHGIIIIRPFAYRESISNLSINEHNKTLYKQLMEIFSKTLRFTAGREQEENGALVDAYSIIISQENPDPEDQRQTDTQKHSLGFAQQIKDNAKLLYRTARARFTSG
jgi:hypothetical protein